MGKSIIQNLVSSITLRLGGLLVKKFFDLLGFDPVKKKTTVRTELMAGLVTFLSMAYILTVNPNQVFGSDSPYWASAFIATALGAVIGTLLMLLPLMII